MILPRAIKEFLEAPRNDFSWVKAISESELDEAIASLDPKPRFSIPLMKHQKACFLVGIAEPKFLFFLEMGLGKTILTLELLTYFYQQRKFNKGIVLAFNEVGAYVWADEIDNREYKIPYTLMVEDSSIKKWQSHTKVKTGLIITTYPGLVAMVSERVRSKGKGKLLPHLDLIRRFHADYNALVLDESTRTANHQALTFQVVKKIAQNVDIKYALSGRPFGRDPTPLWGQFNIIDGGDTLHPTISMFREAFFTKKKNYWSGSAFSFDWQFDKSKEEELARIVKNRSIICTADECTTLPPITRIIRRVSLPEEAESYYKKLIVSLRKAEGDFTETKNIFLRMRQISSGFLGVVSDETGERVQVEFDKNPKLDLLMTLVGEIPEGRKAIIFYDYTWSGKKIHETLNELGIKNEWIWSGTKDYRKARDNFVNPKGVNILVVNNKIGAYSLNLQAASITLFYEAPVSSIERDQAEKRTHRTGQDKHCFIYDLVVKGTVDERILSFYKEGGDLFKAILKDPSLVERLT